MEKYIVIFQHGPVQEFISTARKTDDFKAGSWLLSYATSVLMEHLQKEMGGEIIFPYSPNSENGGRRDNVAGFPNRAAAIVEPYSGHAGSIEQLTGFILSFLSKFKWAKSFTRSRIETHLKKRLCSLQQLHISRLKEMFGKVEEALTGNRSSSDEQVPASFESYFVFVPYEDTRHKESFQDAERLMAARKNIRSFRPFDQVGNARKCTQCGIRLSLVIENNNYKYVFKKNEHLCAICAGKRLYKKMGLIGENTVGVPSTTTICISAWLDENRKKFAKETVDAFLKDVENLGGMSKGAAVPKNISLPAGNGLSRPAETYPKCPSDEKEASRIFRIEGDFWIADSYERLKKDAEEAGNRFNIKRETAQRFLGAARKHLLSMLTSDVPPPPKYYAIVTFDADDMGSHLEKVSSKKEHKDLSKAMYGFGKEIVRIAHEDCHGYLIYSGGDEGICLCPLTEVFDIMENIRGVFVVAMPEDEESPFTISMGVALLHHQSPLGQGLITARLALERAKRLKRKNGFGLTITKRSGTTNTCVSPWKHEEMSIFEFVRQWCKLYSDENIALSPRWWYKFSALEQRAQMEDGRYSLERIKSLLFQIIPRHTMDAQKGIEVVTKTLPFLSYPEPGDFKNLSLLLYLPLFLERAAGGIS